MKHKRQANSSDGQTDLLAKETATEVEPLIEEEDSKVSTTNTDLVQTDYVSEPSDRPETEAQNEAQEFDYVSSTTYEPLVDENEQYYDRGSSYQHLPQQQQLYEDYPSHYQDHYSHHHQYYSEHQHYYQEEYPDQQQYHQYYNQNYYYNNHQSDWYESDYNEAM